MNRNLIRLGKVFSTSKSMDRCEKEINYILKNNNETTKIYYWEEIFKHADIFGRNLNTAPQIRGRAAEKIIEHIFKYVCEKFPNYKMKGFHSYHFEGTEQDYIFLTPHYVFFIESKAMKSTSSSHALNVVQNASNQNNMHMDRFARFLDKNIGPNISKGVVARPIIVTTHKGNKNNVPSLVGNNIVVHITRLAKEIYNRVVIGMNSGTAMPNYEKIYNFLNSYYNSAKHKQNIIDKKKRHGYV